MKRTWLQKIADAWWNFFWRVHYGWRWLVWRLHPCYWKGHDWSMDGHGGRGCSYAEQNFQPGGCCSQPVFVCARCGEIDYGDRGGPGWLYCRDECEERAAFEAEEAVRQGHDTTFLPANRQRHVRHWSSS